MDPSSPPRRRLRHRVPLPIRHHWRPVALLMTVMAVLLVFFGGARVTPYVTSASTGDHSRITENLPGTTELYDASVAHEIELTYDERDFDEMMKEFADSGEKEYIEADLVIDGTFIPSVGIRLKGNSTLMSLRSNGGGPGGGQFPGGGQMPEGMQLPDGAGQMPEGMQLPDGAQGAEGGPQVRVGGMGGMGARLSADKPAELPWLIKIDEYVEGRAYQNHRQISVRPGSNAEMPLNEAVSLASVDASGQVAQRYAFSTVKANNSAAVGRLIVENPGVDYANSRIDGTGVLYKALSTGSFAYQGDDPTAYDEDFKQLTMKGEQDLQPVIDLLKWVEKSSDEEFAAGLGSRVDVASFARYTATQNLLLNSDDMAGPGKNYYLWYDLTTKRFSVLGWDYNLTLSGNAATGADQALSMGGGMGGPAGQGGAAPGGQQPQQGQQQGQGQAPGQMPQMPNNRGGQGGPAGQDGDDDGRRVVIGGGGGMGGNKLKERFLAAPAFDAVYAEAYRELYAAMYSSGTTLAALEDIVEQAQAVTTDQAGITTKADQLRTTITTRTTSLATDPIVTGGSAPAAS